MNNFVTHLEKNQTLEDVKDTSEIVLFDFYADWCGPCQMMNWVFETLSHDEEVNSKVSVVKVNVEEHNALAATYWIRWIPAFMVFKGGEYKDWFSWYKNAEDLKNLILSA